MTAATATALTTAPTAAADGKVLVCLNHGAEDPESVLVAYLVGVEALRAGKEAVMFLTKDAIHVATPGFVKTVEVPDGAPAIADLHDEYLAKGGRLIACPVCVRVRGMMDAEWVPGTQIAGVPAILEYTTGGALVFNY